MAVPVPYSDRLLLGVDVGSHSVRAGLFAPQGDLLAMGVSEHRVLYPRPGWAEQNPEEVWQALLTAVQSCLSKVEPPLVKKVACMAIAGTAVSMLACDQHHSPLFPVILWMDTRASSEAAQIFSLKDEWLRYTGDHVSPEWMLPKALWLKRNHPQVYEEARIIAELTDWLDYRLTGRWTASLTTVSAEWTYVHHLGGWPLAILESIGLDDLPARFPANILAPGEIIGPLTPYASSQLGLPDGVWVAKGLMDSYAAALGMNIFEPGRVILSLGTSSAYLTLSEVPRFHPGLLGPISNAFGWGTWALQGGQTSAGSVIHWFIENIAGQQSYTELDAGASSIAPGAGGLVALDCWQGSRSPYRDPLARGAIWGLRIDHTQYHIYRALLESVAFGGRQILEAMKSIGVETKELWVCGGGARSPLWLKIHADVIGIPLVVSNRPDVAIIGAAICAAVGMSIYKGLAEAASIMMPEGKKVEVDSSNHERYTNFYEEYLKGYPILRDSFHRLNRLVNKDQGA